LVARIRSIWPERIRPSDPTPATVIPRREPACDLMWETMMKTVMGAAALGLIALSGCGRPAGGNAQAQGAAPNAAPTTPGLPDAPAAAPSPAAPGPALAQASDSSGEVRMEVTDATRAAGVLTVKVRFTLVSGTPSSRPLPGGNASDVYLSAGDRKYMLLKDDQNKELMSSNAFPSFDRVGATQSWWGKFPAPAPDVKAVNFYFSGFDPVENLAIADR
jgi:hypothetical protein